MKASKQTHVLDHIETNARNNWPLNLLDSRTNEDTGTNQQTLTAVMYAPVVVCLIPYHEVVCSYCLQLVDRVKAERRHFFLACFFIITHSQFSK